MNLSDLVESSFEPIPMPLQLWIRYRCPCCGAGHAVQASEGGAVRRCRSCKRAVRIPTPRPDELRRARGIGRLATARRWLNQAG